jgi:hypothetical protein
MERQFSVEAKTFSFSVHTGRSVCRLEEKRKGYSGFISLGIKCSEGLAGVVEEALETQRKEDFARSFRDEMRVVKVRMGSNKAGFFLEVAVFVEGARKGVIRLPEGRGGWGWKKFVDELRLLIAQLVVKVSPEVPAANAGVVGSPPSFKDVLVAPPGGVKSSCVEDQVPKEVSSVLGRALSMGGGSCLMEALRSLAMEFLARMRAEVDRVIFFGLGLKTNATMGIRRKVGRMLSRLGLKPKLLHGFSLRGRRKSLFTRRLGSTPATVISLGSPETNRTPPVVTNLAAMEVAQSSPALFNAGSVEMGSTETSPELAQIVPAGVEEFPFLMGSPQIVPESILISTEAAAEIALPSPETNRTLPEVAQSSPSMNDAGSVLMGSSQTSPELPVLIGSSQTSPELPVLMGFSQTSPELPVLMGSSQTSPELAQIGPVGVEEIVDVAGARPDRSESVSAVVLPTHEAQLLVKGLTEVQAWYVGWLRDGTRSHELLDAIDRFEEQTRRNNVVVPPPDCSMEFPQWKAKLEAFNINRETVVRRLAGI